MDSLFKEIFDVNDDNELDTGEELLGIGAVLSLLNEIDEDDEPDEEFDEEIDEILDSLNGEIESINLDELICELEEKLENLLDALEKLELEEPDDDESPAYSRWEERCDELNEKISDVEYELDEAKAQLII